MCTNTYIAYISLRHPHMRTKSAQWRGETKSIIKWYLRLHPQRAHSHPQHIVCSHIQFAQGKYAYQTHTCRILLYILFSFFRYEAVFDAFSSMDARRARAARIDDEKMIYNLVEEHVGFTQVLLFSFGPFMFGHGNVFSPSEFFTCMYTTNLCCCGCEHVEYSRVTDVITLSCVHSPSMSLFAHTFYDSFCPARVFLTRSILAIRLHILCCLTLFSAQCGCARGDPRVDARHHAA